MKIIIMRILSVIIFVFLLSCSGAVKKNTNNKMEMTFNQTEILEELDFAFKEIPGKYFPEGNPKDIKYNFFLDLEHGYCETAGSRIHLYADSSRWAIVFEKSGYQNRATSVDITLDYIGNCIDYPVDTYFGINYITNSGRVTLIHPTELERIQNKNGKEMENFELIGHNIKEIKVRDKFIPFDNDYTKYEKYGIEVRSYENPHKLIGFGELVRYLHETNPELISATDDDIRKHIPKDIPKLMTINDFHFTSFYEKSLLPSRQETYQLIAKILVTKDTTLWLPTQKPNNHWSNWESGNL